MSHVSHRSPPGICPTEQITRPGQLIDTDERQVMVNVCTLSVFSVFKMELIVADGRQDLFG
jgi:hypothetical protein